MESIDQTSQTTPWTPPSGRWRIHDGQKAVEEWLSSNMSQRAWCAHHGINTARFAYWIRKVHSETEADMQDVQFLCMEPSVAPPSSSTGVSIVLGTSVRLSVDAGFDAAALRRVVEALTC